MSNLSKLLEKITDRELVKVIAIICALLWERHGLDGDYSEALETLTSAVDELRDWT